MQTSTFEALLGRLLRVAAPSGALLFTACITTESGGDAGRAGDAGAATDARAADGALADAAPTDAEAPDAALFAYQPFPEDVGCHGTASDFTGECCDNVACFNPDDGGACPDPASGDQYAIAASAGYSSLGSGSCLCGVTGPFDPAVANPEADDGVCCYIVTIQGCEGRPLTIAGRARFARAVARTDWT